MRFVRICQIFSLFLTGILAISPALASHGHRSPTSGHSHSSSKRKSAVHQIRGQRQIDTGRAREIQAALIRESYLTGEPTGEWDQQSQDAMRSYQAAHNWQTKIIPDSRALIQLGLGPSPNSVAPVAPVSNEASTPLKTAEPAKPTERTRNGSSNALTLADSHSILN